MPPTPNWDGQSWVQISMIQNPPLAFSLLSLSYTDLRSLEVLEIREPFETVSAEFKQAQVMKRFNETVRINKEERYEVDLPWRENCPLLMDNKQVAKNRLLSTSRKLVLQSRFSEYGQVFKNRKTRASSRKRLRPSNRKTHTFSHIGRYSRTRASRLKSGLFLMLLP